MLGAYTRLRQGARQAVAQDLETVSAALSGPPGKGRNSSPEPCQRGEQQMLAIGRALMARPQPLGSWTSPPWALRRWLVARILETLAELRREGPHDFAGGTKRPGGA